MKFSPFGPMGPGAQSSPQPGDILQALTNPPSLAPPSRMGGQQQFGLPPSPNPFTQLFEQSGQQYGVDPQLLQLMAYQESRFDPNAVSRKGAQGLMQFMPATANEFGIDPFDPDEAIPGAARYMSQLQGQFNDPFIAAGAYNWGPGNMQRAGGDLSRAPKETQDYVNYLRSGMQGGMTPSPQQGMFNPMMGGGGASPDLMAQAQGQQFNNPNPQLPGGPQDFAMSQGAGGQQQQQPLGQQPGMPPQQGQPAQGVAPGMLSLPSPETNMGFWDTLRSAAQRDPGQFYMILSQLALNSPQGVQQQVMYGQQQQQQQVANELERENINAKRVEHQESRNYRTEGREDTQQHQRDQLDQRFVDSVRNRGSAAGVLEDFETTNGTVETRQQAQQLEQFISQRSGETKAFTEKSKYLQQLARNPKFDLEGQLKSYTTPGRPDYDATFANAVKETRKRGDDLAAQRREELALRTQSRKLLNDRVKKTLADDKVSAADRISISNMWREEGRLFSELQRLESELAGSELLIGSGFLTPEMEATFNDKKARIEELRSMLSDAENQVNEYVTMLGAARPVAAPTTPTTKPTFTDGSGDKLSEIENLLLGGAD